jgi:hypothetical protein
MCWLGVRKLLPAKVLVCIKNDMTAMRNATFNIKARLRGNPIRWLIVGGALLVVAIVVGTAMMVGVFRDRALQSAERELDNTVLLLARR